MNARGRAVRVLYRVLQQQQHLKVALADILPEGLNSDERRWIVSLCYQTLRHLPEAESRWQRWLDKPLKDRLVGLVLSTAVVQKFHMHTPDHAIVDEAVRATRQLRKSWAAGLVNSVLRRALNDAEFCSDDETVRWQHPRWWIERIRTDWPEQADALLDANNQHPPLWLRLAPGATLSCPSHAHPCVPSARRIEPEFLAQLAELKDARAWVQDAAAQLAAPLLAPRAGERVLDACASPGGKACHLWQLQNDVTLHALEIDPERLPRLRENLQRAGASVKLILGDAAHPESWYKGEAYDKILLDVPCSASGVIRRNPDIKYLRTEEHLTQLQQTQRRILQQMAGLLVNGGRMLYVTCSILKQENENNMRWFLQTHPAFSEVPLALDWAEVRPHGVQILSGCEEMDGFYYCLLQKNETRA